jgi:23S rRNA (guanine745-N1)-methyltransferase
LQIGTQAATCGHGHSFDIARQGYLNLLGGAQPRHADTAAMVSARRRVHAAGVFGPVAAALGDLAQASGLGPDQWVLEAGAGDAYYLSQVVDRTGAPGLALDISTAAARVAAKAAPRIASIVADVWRPLPLLDHTIGLVLCVFAPRNLAEFVRVLQPGGRLAVVTPNPGHLAGLRQRYGLIGIGEGKTADLQQGPFRLASAEPIGYSVELTAALASDLVAMGPNAFHDPPAVADGIGDQIDVTLHLLEPRQ